MSVQRVIVEADLEGFDYSGLSNDAEVRVRRFLQACIGKTPDQALAVIDSALATQNTLKTNRAMMVRRFNRRVTGLRTAK